MKLYLINKNPMISKLVSLSAAKIGVELVESQEIDKEITAEIVLLDDECYEADSFNAYKEANADSKFGLFYAKNEERIDGFGTYIQKPFLPTDLVKTLSEVSGIAVIDVPAAAPNSQGDVLEFDDGGGELDLDNDLDFTNLDDLELDDDTDGQKEAGNTEATGENAGEDLDAQLDFGADDEEGIEPSESASGGDDLDTQLDFGADEGIEAINEAAPEAAKEIPEAAEVTADTALDDLGADLDAPLDLGADEGIELANEAKEVADIGGEEVDMSAEAGIEDLDSQLDISAELGDSNEGSAEAQDSLESQDSLDLGELGDLSEATKADGDWGKIGDLPDLQEIQEQEPKESEESNDVQTQVLDAGDVGAIKDLLNEESAEAQDSLESQDSLDLGELDLQDTSSQDDTNLDINLDNGDVLADSADSKGDDLDISMDDLNLEETAPQENSESLDLGLDEVSETINDIGEVAEVTAEEGITESAEESQEVNEDDSQKLDFSDFSLDALESMPRPDDLVSLEVEDSADSKASFESAESSIEKSAESQDTFEAVEQENKDESLENAEIPQDFGDFEADSSELEVAEEKAEESSVESLEEATSLDDDFSQLSVEGIGEALGEPVAMAPEPTPIVPDSKDSQNFNEDLDLSAKSSLPANIQADSIESLIGTLQALQTKNIKDLLSGATLSINIQFPKKD